MPTSTTEFIPKGKMVATSEQFPDFDALDDDGPKKGGKKGAGKKGKKKAVVTSSAPTEDDDVDHSVPWKGKKSNFFEMKQAATPLNDPMNPNNFEMTDEQWNFIFKYYPEHGASPYNMMVWLYGQAYASEEQYRKPTLGGEAVGGEEDDEQSHEMGFGKTQQTNKKQNKQSQEAIKEAQAKKLADLKEKAQPGKTDAEKEESKIMKVYKDKEVNMAPEGLVEVDTTREPISMVFIGHVDAGKSTICGNLMYIMGVVDARTIEKYKQEAKEKGRDSWWLAYVMDVSDDEKAKGKTVEVGRATFDTPSKKYTIFDAPGHKNYVPNMIMGAAMADVAGLVISARKGEFEAGFEKDG